MSTKCGICEQKKPDDQFKLNVVIQRPEGQTKEKAVLKEYPACDTCVVENLKPSNASECVNCGKKPVVPATKQCGKCHFGTEDMADGAWWDKILEGAKKDEDNEAAD